MVKPLPSPSLLREYLQYAPNTGRLRWRPDLDHRNAGQTTGTTRNAQGNRIIRFAGHTILTARVVWALVHGKWPSRRIIFANGDRQDMRLENIQELPPNGARADRKVPHLSWDGDSGRWRVEDQLFSNFSDAEWRAREVRAQDRARRRARLQRTCV